MSEKKPSSAAKNTVAQTTNKNTANNTTGKFTSKRIAAIIGMVLLVSLYIITLLVAIFDTSEGGKWFMISMSATFAIPFLLWIYIWIYGQLTGKKTIADINYNIGPNIDKEQNDDEQMNS